MISRVAAIGVVALMTGCATVINDPTHPMKVDAKTTDGQTVSDAECKLANDKWVGSVKSGDTAMVRRSSADLEIKCSHPSHPDALGRAVSSVNAAIFGNIVIGGLIGAVVDHAGGNAYTYPNWVQLVFGRSLEFDRSKEKDGEPVIGSEPGPRSTPRAENGPVGGPGRSQLESQNFSK